jgi:hypothetical protein
MCPRHEHPSAPPIACSAPLASLARAWKPETWYGLADIEPIFRFDTHAISQTYVRGGFGYIVSRRARLGFVYWGAPVARSSGGSLSRTSNIFQVDLKIGLSEGILERIRNPKVDE